MLKSEVCICRTLLNSPLLRRKRGDRGGGGEGGGGGDVGGSGNKSSLDSSEEDLNICANSATNSPTPRHRLLQVQLYFWSFSPSNLLLSFHVLKLISNIQSLSSSLPPGEIGQTPTGRLSEPRDFPEAKTQTESNSKFYFA